MQISFQFGTTLRFWRFGCSKLCNCCKNIFQFGTALRLWRFGCSKMCNCCKFLFQFGTTLRLWRFGCSKVCNCCQFLFQFGTTLRFWRFGCSKVCNCCKFLFQFATTLRFWRFGCSKVCNCCQKSKGRRSAEGRRNADFRTPPSHGFNGVDCKLGAVRLRKTIVLCGFETASARALVKHSLLTKLAILPRQYGHVRGWILGSQGDCKQSLLTVE